MFANPFYDKNGNPTSNDNGNQDGSNTDPSDDDMLGDMTEQSVDVSNIEDNQAPHPTISHLETDCSNSTTAPFVGQ